MKNKSKFSNQARALVTSTVPLRLLYFATLLVRYFRKNITDTWIGKAIQYELMRASESYPTLWRYARLLRGLPLHKLDSLGLFFIPSAREDEGDELGLTNSSADRKVWYPFRPIPNIRAFEVQLSGFDWVFALFGIRKRFEPQMEFERFENFRMNKYMAHQLARLEDARIGKLEVSGDGSKIHRTPNPELYFRICDSICKHSTVFFCWQLAQTYPKWHRDTPFWKVKAYFKVHNRISRDKLARLSYKRAFIPKANNKFRPLGVPTMPWRIYLGLWNKFLLKFIRGKIPLNQHAYQPLKGTISAWRDIVKLLSFRNIYAYDLSKYFDKVSLERCMLVLRERYNVPEEVCDRMEFLHYAVPQNLKEDVFEPIISTGALTAARSIVNLPTIETLPERLEIPKSYIEQVKQVFHKEIQHGVWLSPEKFNQPFNFQTVLLKGIRDWIKQLYFPGIQLGVPQGAPISPLLAILAQEYKMDQANHSEKKGKEKRLVKYSDDGLFFSNDDKAKFIDDPESGIHESKEKSYWVKREGRWLTPLEFLGLSYNGSNDELRANTRSGSSLIFTKYDLLDYIDFRELVGRPECNRHQRAMLPLNPKWNTWPRGAEAPEGFANHHGTCMLERGDPLDCPCPTMCEHGLGPKLRNMADPDWSPGGRTWQEMVKHRVFGLIQSRLYQGTWNLEDFKQDFKLTFSKGSWMHGIGKHWRRNESGMSVFTSTSFAIHSLVQVLKCVRKGEKYTTLTNGHTFSTKSIKETEKRLRELAKRVISEAENKTGWENHEGIRKGFTGWHIHDEQIPYKKPSKGLGKAWDFDNENPLRVKAPTFTQSIRFVNFFNAYRPLLVIRIYNTLFSWSLDLSFIFTIDWQLDVWLTLIMYNLLNTLWVWLYWDKLRILDSWWSDSLYLLLFFNYY